jgi:hypothetical protein
MKPLEAESNEVQARLREMVEAYSVPVRSTFAFGLMCDQSFWITVHTDKERDRILNDADLMVRINAVFDTGYRAAAEELWKGRDVIKELFISVQSQETVDREFAGQWHYATK